MWAGGFCRVPCEGGVQVAVHHFGGTGPPLVTLAANGFMPQAYLPLIKKLKNYFTCYGIDLRGHGDSPSGPGTDLLHHGADVAKVVETLKLQGAYAFGHCLGGMAAIQAELLQPGSFCQIITYEPILYRFEEVHAIGYQHLRWTAPKLLQKVIGKRQRYFKSRQDARQRLQGKPPWNRFSPECLDQYVEHGFMDVADGCELKQKPAVEAETMIWPQHLDLMQTVYPALGRIQCPVSILSGDDISAINPTEFIAHYIENATQELACGRFERLEGLQHLGPLEDPERVAARILAHADRTLYKAPSSLKPATAQPRSRL
ncbi:hypothetical protein WJX74_006968 [Apatococcus lobatus]|uniref:AB hydrolase-1 domain-containing protein n=1 Tax=Apatococcus lobatus TaxID=904363 RepID=A0AAW1RPK3_9CHLO